MQEPCNWCGMAEPLVDSIIEQLHSALYYMHENNVSHLDLKENNVLVFETPDGVKAFWWNVLFTIHICYCCYNLSKF